jgi:hypothetical protein
MANTCSICELSDPPVDDFDIGLHLDELRRHTTPWLEVRRLELVREQHRLHVEELAVIAVLDERGRVDDSLAAADGVSVQAVREKVETARAIGELPRLAAAAHAGRVSPAQLAPAAKLADPANDDEIARRAADTSPVDLSREARAAKAPTSAEFAARRARRSLRWWWDQDHTVLSLRGDLPDLQGVAVEQVLEHMIERMRPAKGDRWDTRDHRGADALVDLCVNFADAHAEQMPQPLFVAHCTPGQPITIAGISLPDALVEQLLPNARVEAVVDDVHGVPVSQGRPRPVLATRIRRSILRRDGQCRYPGCDRRVRLEVHHLVPVSWGGTDSLSNLAAVCAGHHPQLAPHGEWLLTGNPNRTDGLRLIRVDNSPRSSAAERAPDPTPREGRGIGGSGA